MRRTKIIATIGPASEHSDVLASLVRAGIDAVRLNAAHSDRDAMQRRLEGVRAAAEEAGRHVAVMLDLAGPKIRVGDIAPDTELQAGEAFRIVSGACTGNARQACVLYEGLAADLDVGAWVLIDDGKIRLRVTGTKPGRVDTVVEVGGRLLSDKGVNVPDVTLSLDAVTAKDRADLAWALDAGVDVVAQSFVRSAEDIESLRALMGERRVPIVAKVEKHEAVIALREIVEAADVVMVARGDLGVETSPEVVPVVQRAVIEACARAGRPVLVATQMLESMIAAPTPTRAEASDIANAVFDGVDGLLLTAETAVGAYPVEAVATMARIASVAESGVADRSVEGTWRTRRSQQDVSEAVSAAVCELAEDLGVAAIVTATRSGATARAVASRRPNVPIVAATTEASVARQLALVWGVTPVVVARSVSIDETVRAGMEAVLVTGLAHPGDLVAITAGVTVDMPGATDLIQVVRLT